MLSISCYQCNSFYEPECKNLFDYEQKRARFYKPCPMNELGEAFCRTTYYKSKLFSSVHCNYLKCYFLVHLEDHNRVIRSCGYVQSDEECYSTKRVSHFEEVCQCFIDGCNDLTHWKN